MPSVPYLIFSTRSPGKKPSLSPASTAASRSGVSARMRSTVAVTVVSVGLLIVLAIVYTLAMGPVALTLLACLPAVRALLAPPSEIQKKAARLLGLTYHQFRGLYRKYQDEGRMTNDE